MIAHPTTTNRLVMKIRAPLIAGKTLTVEVELPKHEHPEQEETDREAVKRIAEAISAQLQCYAAAEVAAARCLHVATVGRSSVRAFARQTSVMLNRLTSAFPRKKGLEYVAAGPGPRRSG